MTLTEMLGNKAQKHHESFILIVDAKDVFTQWLKEVGLPDHDTIGKGGCIFNATESTRDLLILLVDEP